MLNENNKFTDSMLEELDRMDINVDSMHTNVLKMKDFQENYDIEGSDDAMLTFLNFIVETFEPRQLGYMFINAGADAGRLLLELQMREFTDSMGLDLNPDDDGR